MKNLLVDWIALVFSLVVFGVLIGVIITSKPRNEGKALCELNGGVYKTFKDGSACEIKGWK